MSSKITADEIKILCLFNEQTKRILEIDFLEELRDNNLGLSLDFDFDHNTMTTNARLHDFTKLRAVLLTLRIFMQTKEPIGITNFADLYNKMNIDPSYLNRLTNITKVLDNKLNESAFTFITPPPTNQQVLDTVLYGIEAHLNQHDTFIQWTNDAHNENMVLTEFERIVEIYIYCIVAIMKLNEEILQKYS